MMSIRDYVEGALIQVGAHVRIGDSEDETFDETFTGQRGVVVHLEYECGCGQTYPNDPMIGVQFSDGQVEEFWFEELVVE
jgi:hypothetical protein